MSSLDFQLGLLFGHLGRSSSKFKAEGLSINIPKIGAELGMSPEELTAILLHAASEGMLELTIAQAVVKLIPQDDGGGIKLEIVAAAEQEQELIEQEDLKTPLDFEGDSEQASKRKGRS